MMDYLRYVVIVELFVFIALGARLWGRDVATVSRPAFWKGIIDGGMFFLIAVAVFVNVLNDERATDGLNVVAGAFGIGIIAQIIVIWKWRQPKIRGSRADRDG